MIDFFWVPNLELLKRRSTDFCDEEKLKKRASKITTALIIIGLLEALGIFRAIYNKTFELSNIAPYDTAMFIVFLCLCSLLYMDLAFIKFAKSYMMDLPVKRSIISALFSRIKIHVITDSTSEIDITLSGKLLKTYNTITVLCAIGILITCTVWFIAINKWGSNIFSLVVLGLFLLMYETRIRIQVLSLLLTSRNNAQNDFKN